MKISIVSINSITNIPLIRFVVEYFTLRGDQVEICETHLSTSNSYFKDSENLKLNYYRVYSDYNSFVKDSRENVLKKYLQLLQSLVKQVRQKTDCIYTNDYQVLFLAIIFKIFRIGNFQIIYHQFEVVEIKKLNKVNRVLYNFVCRQRHKLSLFIAPEINRLKYFKKESKYSGSTEVIPNSCRLNNVFNSKIEGVPDENKVILHVGSVGGRNHYFFNYLEAIKLLKDKPISFVFVGRVDDTILKKIENIKLTNTIFIPSVPHEELSIYYNRADLGVILYKSNGINYEFCAPNKLYEMWSYGLPVIGHKLSGLLGVFKKSFQGELINFDDVDELSKSLLTFQIQKSRKQLLQKYFEDNLKVDLFLNKLAQIKK